MTILCESLKFVQDEATVNPVTFEPSIVQAAAGDGQITLRYLSSDEFGNTTVQLLPSFTTEEVCVSQSILSKLSRCI